MAKKSEKIMCDNCIYFRRSSVNSGLGRCHYNPPYTDPRTTRGAWPLINSNQWCGKHKPKIS